MQIMLSNDSAANSIPDFLGAAHFPNLSVTYLQILNPAIPFACCCRRCRRRRCCPCCALGLKKTLVSLHGLHQQCCVAVDFIHQLPQTFGLLKDMS